MFKNKLFLIVVAMLIAITLILSAGFVLWNFMDKGDTSSDPHQAAKNAVESVEGQHLTAAETKELAVEVKEITTNIADKGRFVKASFVFELENKKTKTEFEDLSFKVKGFINQTLADMTAADISGSKGQEHLISQLMNKINSILTEGKIRQIWITEFILS